MLKVPLQPKFSDGAKNFIMKALSSLDSTQMYYWFSTSGSTLQPGQSKWIALTKEALLSSAQAVNDHLQVERQDIWINPLPLFHVGGFCASIRAEQAGIAFYSLPSKWDADFFTVFLEEKRATLTSVVPAQVYDIISKNLKAPTFLRAAVLGGGHLDEEIFKEARFLGWPLLPSYGMTELASQIATADLESLKTNKNTFLKPLKHIKWQKIEGRWSVSSPALFSKIVYLDHEREKTLSFESAPKEFFLPDAIEKTEEGMRVLGRADGVVKIVGELVSVQKVSAAIERVQIKSFPSTRCAVICRPDKRRGTHLVLFTEVPPKLWEMLKSELTATLLPFEIPQEWRYINKIPLSSLGKPLLHTLSLSAFNDVSSPES